MHLIHRLQTALRGIDAVWLAELTALPASLEAATVVGEDAPRTIIRPL